MKRRLHVRYKGIRTSRADSNKSIYINSIFWQSAWWYLKAYKPQLCRLCTGAISWPTAGSSECMLHFKRPVLTLINLNKSQVTLECLGDEIEDWWDWNTHQIRYALKEGDPPSQCGGHVRGKTTDSWLYRVVGPLTCQRARPLTDDTLAHLQLSLETSCQSHVITMRRANDPYPRTRHLTSQWEKICSGMCLRCWARERVTLGLVISRCFIEKGRIGLDKWMDGLYYICHNIYLSL